MVKDLSLEVVKKIDKSDMLSLLMDLPLHCKSAEILAKDAEILLKRNDFNKIIFLGVGGSAIGADLVKSYLYFEINIPILVVREYELPACVDSSSLVFVSSYSGDTEETLSAYEEAKKKGASIIVVSSGGLLKRYALEEKYTFIEVPRGLPPRCALGYMSIIPLCILSRLGVIKDIGAAIKQLIAVLVDLRDNYLNPYVGEKENIAKNLAGKLFNKFAAIYSSSIHFDIAATRLRGQMAENSKTLASSHLLPEMNHNEIVGWQNPGGIIKNSIVVMFRDKNMHPRVSKRIEITKEILKKQGVDVFEIWSWGEDLLSRIFSLVYISDFISYYLAIYYKIDPAPVERIDYLKRELGKEFKYHNP